MQVVWTGSAIGHHLADCLTPFATHIRRILQNSCKRIGSHGNTRPNRGLKR
ncbi:hypothetical protein HSB1_36910 [Halogranum salarium B-1]|uniref:Uncharacterized protein n=1 Tax=Halogranum salarium B-1 TaxID=1210908 RepID=J3JED8_9EURY|nr:hypothetical protein HSB1_36910 [Halogranum salarium B-1]